MSERSNKARAIWLRNARNWLVLILLLALSFLLAYTPMAGLNSLANLAIAAVMVTIAVVNFMGLRWEKPFVQLAAVGGVFWLFVMFALTLSDYFTRSGAP
jgi:cytochrome c oxidase subunit 4